MSILDGYLGSQIIGGNEAAWLRMMLDDVELLKRMGLPTNLTEFEKEQLIKSLMDSGMITTGFIDGNDTVSQSDEYDPTSGDTPAQWMINMAMHDLGIDDVVDSDELVDVSPDDLQIGETYKLSFPNSRDIICVLTRIQSNSFGDDYFFRNISGGESLCGKAGMCGKDEFPLPFKILSQISIFGLKQ